MLLYKGSGLLVLAQSIGCFDLINQSSDHRHLLVHVTTSLSKPLCSALRQLVLTPSGIYGLYKMARLFLPRG